MGLCQNIYLVYVHKCVNHCHYVESFHVITFLDYVKLLIMRIICLVSKNIWPDLQEKNDMYWMWSNSDGWSWKREDREVPVFLGKKTKYNPLSKGIIYNHNYWPSNFHWCTLNPEMVITNIAIGCVSNGSIFICIAQP